MINTLSIVVSLFGVVFVIVRAVMLDKTLPWFAPVLAAQARPRTEARPGSPPELRGRTTR